MSRFNFEGRCSECNEKVNIMVERLSSNSMKLTADECLDHPGESHILWPQRYDTGERLVSVIPSNPGLVCPECKKTGRELSVVSDGYSYICADDGGVLS